MVWGITKMEHSTIQFSERYSTRMHSKMPGDDKGMAAARAAFLSKDYYAPLRDALCSIALANTGPAPSVLDTGCGEGYYTSGVYRALVRAGRSVTMAGTDISKAILRRAGAPAEIPPAPAGRSS